MRHNRNYRQYLFLDVLYSVLLSIVIISEPKYLPLSSLEILPIYKNFIIVALLSVWFKTLYHNKQHFILLLAHTCSGNGVFNSGLSLIRKFLDIKFTVLILAFSIYFFVFEGVEISQLAGYMVQLFTVSVYTLSVVLFSVIYLKISVKSFQFAFIVLAPYILGFLVFAIFDLNNVLYLSLIPANFNMVFKFSLDLLIEHNIILGLSILLFCLAFVNIFFSISKLRKSIGSLSKEVIIPINEHNR